MAAVMEGCLFSDRCELQKARFTDKKFPRSDPRTSRFHQRQMNESSPSTAAKDGVSVLWLVCGSLFIILWIIGHSAWGMMSLVADLMANDSGSASAGKHMTLIFGMLGGQVLCGAAGIPAGLAFFWRSRRKLLLWLFSILFVVGALIQGGSFYAFFAKP